MRKTVYDQLVALQNMVDAWTEWSEYRIQLTDWILEHTEVDDTVLILGAGACNDYDLQRMVKHFQRIILLDLRKDSMEEALIRQE